MLSASLQTLSTDSRLDVDIRIHVTGSRDSNSPDKEANPAESKTPSSSRLSIETLQNNQRQASGSSCKPVLSGVQSSLAAFSCVTILDGRPDVAKMLKDEADSTPLNGSMDVTSKAFLVS
jgi:hypothetical protein